ncbi:MAG: ribonuclease R [Candidatus Marinimicrobia bacterium]|nr:ribonuclease R [Candidatus Neomarinimicrobiota bacterium]MCF7839575.1 ribonuclease R [Candidatus Neomarinimicrobiota bacterium]
MDRELIRKKILDYLKKNANRAYKQRTLFKHLKLKEPDYGLFKSVLGQLFQEGRIQKTGRHQFGLRPKQETITGTLSVTSRGFGFIETPRSEDIFIGARNLNLALDGDVVRAEILTGKSGENREGRIVEVIRRNRTEFVGIYSMDRFGCWVTPEDKAFHRRFLVPYDQTHNAQEGQLVVVEMVSWESPDQEPVGHVKEVLGTPGDPGLDAVSIIRTFNLPVKWTKAAIAEAKSFSEKSIRDELPHRTDLRHVNCFTIDPASAADFDDAVSIEKLSNGWRLGVFIADVSHYVTPGSPIDRGARERGTSVYLVDRAIHMLPEELAGDLCSLKPDTDRLSMACVMDLDARGEVKKYRIEPAIIQSRKRYTYTQVHQVLTGEIQDEYGEQLQLMNQLWRILHKQRKALGSVDIDLPEAKFKLDDRGFPVEIKASERLDSHRLVEEFMLLANQTVATHIENMLKVPPPFIFRVHDPPQDEDLNRFREILNRVGIQYKLGHTVRPMDFQKVVELVRESPYRHFIEKVALRSMTKAIYTTQNRGHFGLAFQNYTHFTSPIRRYPDLMVHRLLKRYATPDGLKNVPQITALEKVAKHCSTRERVAVEAEREHIKIKQLQYLSKRVGETHKGIISGVMHFGLFIELADTFVEGLVHIRTLDEDWYEYLEDQFALVGRRTRKRFQLGDPVTIRVAAVSVEERMADFELLEHAEQSNGKRDKPGTRKGSRGRKLGNTNKIRGK